MRSANAFRRLGWALALSWVVTARLPAPPLGPRFGPVLAGGGYAYAVAVGDGRAILQGSFDEIAGVVLARPLAMVQADGTIQPGFQFGSGPARSSGDVQIQAVVRLGDGSLVFTGLFDSYQGQPTRNAVRVDGQTGAVLQTYTHPDLGNAAGVRWTFFADGTVYLRTDTSTPVRRWLPGGGFDPGFQSTVTFPRVHGRQQDGRLIVSGFYGSSGTSTYRLQADGSIDASFQGAGLWTSGDGDLQVLPDDRLLRQPSSFLQRRLPDGSPDPTFAQGGILEVLQTGSFSTVLSVPDGRYLVLGGSCVAVSAQGEVQPGTEPSAGAYSGFIEPGGKVVLCGSFTHVNGRLAVGWAQLAGAWTAPPTVSGRIFLRSNVGISALAPALDGGVWMTGSFLKVDGQMRANLAKLRSDGTLDPAFVPGDGLDGFGQALSSRADGGIDVGGYFQWAGGEPRKYLARFGPAGGIESAFAPPNTVNAGVDVLFRTAGGKLLVGGTFGMAAGQPRTGAARFHYDGTLDATFQPLGLTNVQGNPVAVRAFAESADGRIYVGGNFQGDVRTETGETGSVTSVNVVRLQTDGRIDPAFRCDVGTDNYPGVQGLLAEADGGVLITGRLGFSSSSTTSLPMVMRLFPSGLPDARFVLKGDGLVSRLWPTSGGRLWATGTFNKVHGADCPGLVRVLSNATKDPTFDAPGFNGTRFTSAIGLERPDGSAWFCSDAPGQLPLAAVPADPGGTIILRWPEGARLNAGQPGRLRASAFGRPTLSLAWLRNGQPIAGGSDGALALPDGALAAPATYSIRAVDGTGNVQTSGDTSIVLNTPPTMLPPADLFWPIDQNSSTDVLLYLQDAEDAATAWTLDHVARDRGLSALYVAPTLVAGGQNFVRLSGRVSPRAYPGELEIHLRLRDGDDGAARQVLRVRMRDQSYANWKAGYFDAGDLSNASVSGPLADPNGDGLTNLEAYAYGLSPTVRESWRPTVRVVWNGNSPEAEITLRRPMAAAGDVSVEVEFSANLQTWIPSLSALTMQSRRSISTRIEEATFRGPLPADARYLRLAVRATGVINGTGTY